MKAADAHSGGAYKWYVLFVLFLVYVANFVDRQILAILAEDIKRDLGISDAGIGFLYGTVFSLFYAVFGIPLGRFADLWNRKRLIAVGLFSWSLMTALSAFARSFATLALCRLGVGVGEASSGPAAAAIMADYFPPRRRALAMSIISSGVYVGMGVGIFLGGLVVGAWNDAFPDPQLAPLRLSGWRAAFLIVGLPGILLALWVATLKEPVRGANEQLAHEGTVTPWVAVAWELMSVLPPLTLLSLRRSGATRADFVRHGLWAAVIVAAAWLLTRIVGGALQWSIIAFGAYVGLSWMQILARRDPIAFGLVFRTRSFVGIYLGFPLAAFCVYGFSFWSIPYLIRAFDVNAREVGLHVGLAVAVGGWVGIVLGGFLGDRLKQYIASARILVGVLSVVLASVAGVLFLGASRVESAYACILAMSIAMPMWIGCTHATCLDLVLPRMRATALAFSVFSITIIGQANGPYVIGKLSDHFSAAGASPGAALGEAMMWSLLANVVAVMLLVYSALHVQKDECSRIARARALGEPI